jgi:SAM-dependent methyltransferase
MDEKSHYAGEAFVRKEQFVEAALAEIGPARLLDIGCNTGHFSAMAARAGASVVALDADPAVAGLLWRTASAAQLDIQPLVVNIARPTPATGWLNAECPSFLARASGRFDCVMALALLHHVLVTERVPLDDVVKLLSDLTTAHAIVEFVAPGDPMFQRLTRGRDALHGDLTRESFEAACATRFEIVRTESPPDATRALYLLRRRS